MDQGPKANSEHVNLKNGSVAAAASFCTLLAVALCIGGQYVFVLLAGLLVPFAVTAGTAFLLGMFVRSADRRWSVAVGVATGLAAAALMVVYAVSQI
jgi:hypothetical protein